MSPDDYAELLAQMEAAHGGSNLALDLRALPAAPDGVVMGDRRVREMADADAHAQHDPRGITNEQYEQAYREAHGADGDRAQRGDWHGGPGWYGSHGEHGDHEQRSRDTVTWRGSGGWDSAAGVVSAKLRPA